MWNKIDKGTDLLACFQCENEFWWTNGMENKVFNVLRDMQGNHKLAMWRGIPPFTETFQANCDISILVTVHLTFIGRCVGLQKSMIY